MNDLAQLGAAARQIHRRELALEDGILEVIAKVTHRLKDLAQALFVADVVADEIGLAHCVYLDRINPIPQGQWRKHRSRNDVRFPRGPAR